MNDTHSRLAGVYQCALTLHRRGQLAEAMNLYRNVFSADPKHAGAIHFYGMAAFALQNYRDALNFVEKSVALDGSNAVYLKNYGIVLQAAQRHHDAKTAFEKAVSLNPDYAEALAYPLGCTCGECGDYRSAKTLLQKSGKSGIRRWKHLSYCPTFFENVQEIEDYRQFLYRELDAVLAEPECFDKQSLVESEFAPPFNLQHLNYCCRDILEKYAQLFTPTFANVKRPEYRHGKKIRFAFLVTPGHEGGFLRFNSGLIEQLDPEKFEVLLIFSEKVTPQYKNRFRRSDLIHVPFSQNFEEAVRTIHDARCDIIYHWKVGADAWSFFLPMERLAPIQCTSWWTHGTSGLEQIDYYVSWNKAEIPGAKAHYTEKLYLLKTPPQYEPLLGGVTMASRAELGLPEDGAIYFCPHRPAKYHPCFDEYLSEILKWDPCGHIVLLTGTVKEVAEKLMARLRRNIGDENFSRMLFLPKINVTDYFRLVCASTVILNSPVYTGDITTIDGFLYGVPNVTQNGELLIQRYATGFCNEFHVPELAVDTQEHYVHQAVKIATDPNYRADLSERIQKHRPEYFENSSVVREWERFALEVTMAAANGAKRNDRWAR